MDSAESKIWPDDREVARRTDALLHLLESSQAELVPTGLPKAPGLAELTSLTLAYRRAIAAAEKVRQQLPPAPINPGPTDGEIR